MVVVAEAGGDDEDDGEGCRDGVEQVELSDGYVVDAHELLLKGLRLVEDEVVSEHHHDQQQSEPSAASHLHCRIIVQIIVAASIKATIYY